MKFDPNTSLLAGMGTAALQAVLTDMQIKLLKLLGGELEVTIEFTGGSLHRSVTFAKTDIAGLTQLIRMIQAQLGIITSPRFGARIGFH